MLQANIGDIPRLGVLAGTRRNTTQGRSDVIKAWVEFELGLHEGRAMAFRKCPDFEITRGGTLAYVGRQVCLGVDWTDNRVSKGAARLT